MVKAILSAPPKNPDHRLRVGNLNFGSENSGIRPSASNSSKCLLQFGAVTAALSCRAGTISPVADVRARLRGLLTHDGRGGDATQGVAPRAE